MIDIIQNVDGQVIIKIQFTDSEILELDEQKRTKNR